MGVVEWIPVPDYLRAREDASFFTQKSEAPSLSAIRLDLKMMINQPLGLVSKLF